jgi:hypothetical protein
VNTAKSAMPLLAYGWAVMACYMQQYMRIISR